MKPKSKAAKKRWEGRKRAVEARKAKRKEAAPRKPTGTERKAARKPAPVFIRQKRLVQAHTAGAAEAEAEAEAAVEHAQQVAEATQGPKPVETGVYQDKHNYIALVFKVDATSAHYVKRDGGCFIVDKCSHDTFRVMFQRFVEDYPLRRAARVYLNSIAMGVEKTSDAERELRLMLVS